MTEAESAAGPPGSQTSLAAGLACRQSTGFGRALAWYVVFVRLTLPERALSELRAQFARRDAGEEPRLVRLRATLVPLPGASAPSRLEIAVAAGAAEAPPRWPCTVCVYPLARRLVGIPHLYWQGCAHRGATPRVDLALNPGRGCSAALLVDEQVVAVDELCLAGSRMERWRPALMPNDLLGDVPADGRFSRYAGALGGDAVQRRVAALRIGVFGHAAVVAEFAHAAGCCGATIEQLELGDCLAAVARVDVVVFDACERTLAECDALASAASRLSRVVVTFAGGEGVRLAVPGDACAHGWAALRLAGSGDCARGRFVASYALFLVERLVTGDLQGSLGVRFDFGAASGPTARPLAQLGQASCRCGVWPAATSG